MTNILRTFILILSTLSLMFSCSRESQKPRKIKSSRGFGNEDAKILIEETEEFYRKNPEDKPNNLPEKIKEEVEALKLSCNDRQAELPELETSALTKDQYLYILEDLLNSPVNSSDATELLSIISKSNPGSAKNGFITHAPISLDQNFMESRIEIGAFFANALLQNVLKDCSDNSCSKANFTDFVNTHYEKIYGNINTKSSHLSTLEELYDKTFQATNDLNKALLDGLNAFFASPYFHLHNFDQSGNKLSQIQIARKISFFVTSSIPDDLLLQDAIEGKLTSPEIRSSHVERLLQNDANLKRMSHQFISQFYGFNDSYEFANENIYNGIPAKDIFDSAIFAFAFMIKNNKALTDYINLDKIYASDSIANAYELDKKEVSSSEFISNGDQLSGLLFHPITFLTTAGGNEKTQYVHRGLQLMSRYICKEFPPLDPASQEELERVNEEAKEHDFETVQELIQFHRSQSTCNACHKHIDGLGVAFESFDRSGNYRTHYTDGKTVDASGLLFKNNYSNHREMKTILSDSFEFQSCMVKQLNSFASQYSPFKQNSCILSDVMQTTETSLGFLDIIKNIVTSEQFILKK